MRLVGPMFDTSGMCLRGNLHGHTTESDGVETPGEYLTHYRRDGCDFVAISDHDRLTRPDPAAIPEGLTLIPSFEAGGGPHILCVGVREAFEAGADRQSVIDRVVEQGGIAILNHPNWGPSFSHWEQSEMERLEGYAGIEIYNGVIEALEGSPLALDRWDRLLTAGRRIWGFAHDDAHFPAGVGMGWVVARAESKSPADILRSLREGRFYCSSGVAIDELRRSETEWVVRSRDADRIRFISRWGRVVADSDAVRGTAIRGGDAGPVVEPLDVGEDGLTARYHFRGDEGYVRCELLGRGGRCAWTQPVWIDG